MMTEDKWGSIEHFTQEEFDSPDAPGSGENMDYEFLRKLDQMRDRTGIPLEIAKGGGFRTKAYHKSLYDRIGKKPTNSAHLRGKGADITYKTSHEAWLIMDAAWYEGFKRIEVCDHHIHVDSDETLPQYVLVWGKSA